MIIVGTYFINDPDKAMSPKHLRMMGCSKIRRAPLAKNNNKSLTAETRPARLSTKEDTQWVKMKCLMEQIYRLHPKNSRSISRVIMKTSSVILIAPELYYTLPSAKMNNSILAIPAELTFFNNRLSNADLGFFFHQ